MRLKSFLWAVVVIAVFAVVADIYIKAEAKAAAQNRYTVNQSTVGWDAVTKLADGTDLPTGAIVKYQVWRKKVNTETNEKIGAEITATQATITFAQEGVFMVGVQALRYEGAELVGATDISWSDIPERVKAGSTFEFAHYISLMFPVGLRPVQ